MDSLCSEWSDGAGSAEGPCITQASSSTTPEFVGQPAVADGAVFGIVLDDVDAGDHGIKGIHAARVISSARSHARRPFELEMSADISLRRRWPARPLPPAMGGSRTPVPASRA